ncbi:MAG: Do family serine endopeptidase [Leptothrix sp. (in: b-proteobacteria)]
MNTKILTSALVAAGVLGAGAAGAISLPDWMKGGPSGKPVAELAAPNPGTTATGPSANPTLNPAPVPMLSAAAVPDYRGIVRAFGPAVVGVVVQGERVASAEDSSGAGNLPPGIENDPFFQFFRGMPGLQGRGSRGKPSAQPFRGQGSGFIIASDGLILTNAHVVRDAKEVTVKLSDQREFAARVLGSDLTTDIAVLRIDAKGLPTVRLGDPKALEVGDRVLAIGAPYGLEQSATQGIVSAKGRSLPGDAVVPFIQTDAAVNPGNSGGPLFDGTGSVVGINAQIYSQSGGFQGLSFAIPINVALQVKDQIVATGHASHARLGVQVQDVDQALAESFGLAKPEGALISGIAPKSAAAAAGLQPGDVILAVNGEAVARSGALSSLIGLSTPGQKVTLKVWREHASRDIDAKLGSAADAANPTAMADEAGGQRGQIGLALRSLTPKERREAQVEQGLLVEQVSGPAAKAGIEAGDVLLAINGRPVQSIEQLQSVLGKNPKRVALLVQRDGEKIFVPVSLS